MLDQALNRKPQFRPRETSFKTNISKKSGKSYRSNLRSESVPEDDGDEEISYSLTQSAHSKFDAEITDHMRNYSGKFASKKSTNSNVVNEEAIEEDIHEAIEIPSPEPEEKKTRVKPIEASFDPMESINDRLEESLF